VQQHPLFIIMGQQSQDSTHSGKGSIVAALRPIKSRANGQFRQKY
jgi:hypothetical protein